MFCRAAPNPHRLLLIRNSFRRRLSATYKYFISRVSLISSGVELREVRRRGTQHAKATRADDHTAIMGTLNRMPGVQGSMERINQLIKGASHRSCVRVPR
jgi:hypothetical protein